LESLTKQYFVVYMPPSCSDEMYTSPSLSCDPSHKQYDSEFKNSSGKMVSYDNPSTMHWQMNARKLPKVCERGDDDGREFLLRSIREFGAREARAYLWIKRVEKHAHNIDRKIVDLRDECASLESKCLACDARVACSRRTLLLLVQHELDRQMCRDLAREVRELCLKETAVRQEFALLGEANVGREADFEAQKAYAQSSAKDACEALTLAEAVLSEERMKDKQDKRCRTQDELHRRKELRSFVNSKAADLKVSTLAATEAQRLCNEAVRHTMSWERFSKASCSTTVDCLAFQQASEGELIEAISLCAHIMKARGVGDDIHIASPRAARHACFAVWFRVVACGGLVFATLALWSCEKFFEL